jgi:hypothetical protein
MKSTYLFLSIMLQAGIMLGQTSFQKTKRSLSGPTVYIGVAQSRFMNPQFVRYLEDKTIKLHPGFAIGLNYVKYPLGFHIGYLNSKMTVQNYDWAYEDGVKVNHKVIDIGMSCYLLPQTKYIQPFVGAAYQKGAIGVGIDESSNDNDLMPSAVESTNFVFRMGLALYFGKNIGLSGEYQRPAKLKDNPEAFNRLTACLTWNMNRFWNK